MFGIIVADYYVVKRQTVDVNELHTMSPSGDFNYDVGSNHKALIALATAGTLSIGLALLGAYGVMFNVGDWGWLIGACAGAGAPTGACPDKAVPPQRCEPASDRPPGNQPRPTQGILVAMMVTN
jgi:cytosine/uracil/thiamine/allantoin permease